MRPFSPQIKNLMVALFKALHLLDTRPWNVVLFLEQFFKENVKTPTFGNRFVKGNFYKKLNVNRNKMPDNK